VSEGKIEMIWADPEEPNNQKKSVWDLNNRAAKDVQKNQSIKL